MSPYTIVLLKHFCVFVERQLESQQKSFEKTVGVKVGAYIVSIDRKTTVYRLEACEIVLNQAVHSNVFP